MEPEDQLPRVGLMERQPEEMLFETDTISAELDNQSPGQGEIRFDPLVQMVNERFERAKDKKRFDEDRMLLAYRNYRGKYGPDTQFSENEKSRVFVKITKVKVVAAYGQLIEVLFGSHKFPLTVEPRHLPDGVASEAHMSVNPAAAPVAMAMTEKPAPAWRFKADGSPVPEQVVAEGLSGRFGYLKDLVEQADLPISEGPGKGPEMVTFSPALIAAKKMEKKIHDQLEEAEADKHLRHVAFEMALFGTGIMKGPFFVNKEYPNWEITDAGKSTYKPLVKTVPMFESVGVWDFYPDPDSVNIGDAEYVIQRHKLSVTQLRSLKSRPFFRKNVIEALIDDGFNYQREYWEHELEEGSIEPNPERWLVLEYWGFMSADMLREYGVKIPREFKKEDQVQANIWVSGNRVIRAVVNPFKPAKIPFYAVPYEINPYSFFGVGVAENTADSQILINGFMRMAVDNSALSGNLIFEVDAQNLAPGQDLEVYPGKVFVREQGAPGQAIFGTQFPNVAEQNLMMFEKARMLADESTGLPSYAHGQMTPGQSPGRTASGMSMAINAANGTTRSVVKNLDDYLLRPLGKAIFSFNMQFDPDPTIKGDLEVKAKGTESLMATEVRSQRLMQFLGVAMNPISAPFIKMDRVLQAIARSLDLDPDEVVNSMADAAVQAALMAKLNPQPGPANGTPAADGTPSQAAGPQGGPTPAKPPAGAQAKDTQGSGGGNPGTGSTPLPGEPGFSARKS